MFDQLTLLERLGIFTVRDFIDIRFCRQMLAEIRQVEKFSPGLVSGNQVIRARCSNPGR